MTMVSTRSIRKLRNGKRALMSTPTVVVIILSSARQERSARDDQLTQIDAKPSQFEVNVPK
jgi:hypothetical protein